nr:hypothetical protein Iba_chr15cCG8160 [Ipomoea batatas]
MKIGGRGRCAAHGRSLRRYCSSSSPLMGWEPAAAALFRRRPAQHCYSRTTHTTLAIALFCASEDRGEEHHRRAPLLPPHNTIGKTRKTASYRRSPCMTSLLAYRGDDRPLLTGNLRGGCCVEREIMKKNIVWIAKVQHFHIKNEATRPEDRSTGRRSMMLMKIFRGLNQGFLDAIVVENASDLQLNKAGAILRPTVAS